jgi:endoglucanase
VKRLSFPVLLCIAGARLFAQDSALKEPVASADLAFPSLRRGINLHHLLNWPDTRDGAGRTVYVWPPFETDNYKITDDELSRLKTMGFDFLRVTADPGIFIAADETRMRHLTRLAGQTAIRLISAGFNVIFDLHPVSVNPEFAPLKLVEGVETDSFKRYADVVEQLARELHDLPHDKFAFELMNEPWLADKAEIARWQPMMELLHKRARKGSPTLPLVLTGAMWGDARALMQLDLKPFEGSNVIYTFHYYDPHTFTHQGVDGDEGAFLAGLQWPANHSNIAKVRDDAFARIDLLKKPDAEARQLKGVTATLLSDYELTAHDRHRVRSDFAAVARWASDHRIPAQRVFLGEFGCVVSASKTPLGEDRVQWLRTIRDTAQEFGFGWSLWAYKGYGGMALFNEGKIDEGIARALDLPR